MRREEKGAECSDDDTGILKGEGIYQVPEFGGSLSCEQKKGCDGKKPLDTCSDKAGLLPGEGICKIRAGGDLLREEEALDAKVAGADTRTPDSRSWPARACASFKVQSCFARGKSPVKARLRVQLAST